MKCIKRYTINCMKEKQREHFNSLYTGTNKAIMELCHDGPYQDGKCTRLNRPIGVLQIFAICEVRAGARNLHRKLSQQETGDTRSPLSVTSLEDSTAKWCTIATVHFAIDRTVEPCINL